jgi:hypothetical protein
MREPLALEVLLHHQPIGRVTQLVDGDRTILSFANACCEQPDRSAHSLSFKDRFGQLLTAQRAYQTQLSPLFSNL